MKKITLENLEQFSLPLESAIAKWLFTDDNNKLAPDEHKDQIFPLTKEAANFLWDFEMKLGINCTDKYFKSVTTFDTAFCDEQKIKKYLYNLGIPFSHKVFIAMQPDTAFILTWKMVIKYSQNIFNSDQVIRDRTMKWELDYHHDGLFTFGKDLIYDGQNEALKNKEKLSNALKEMEERKKRNSFE